jgi:hypothetical protein
MITVGSDNVLPTVYHLPPAPEAWTIGRLRTLVGWSLGHGAFWTPRAVDNLRSRIAAGAFHCFCSEHNLGGRCSI